jgi:glycosyltransferase involved in cell wall biosynthesis
MALPSVTVCICTHSPRIDILHQVFAALIAQQSSVDSFDILLVDNASVPPIPPEVLGALTAAGIRARLVVEPTLGLVQARHRAAQETDSDWLLFVDDDNELASDYITQGLAFAAAHPEAGCFGGRLLLPTGIRPPLGTRPFLAFLGIRDYGDQAIVRLSSRWGPWEPPGAGAWVHRQVVRSYLERRAGHPEIGRLGRRGHSVLASCDDSLLMQSAAQLGLYCAYVPTLVLHHHLDPRRFRAGYLLRLMRAYGASHVLLEYVSGGKAARAALYDSTVRTLVVALIDAAKGALCSPLFALGRVVYHFGAREEARRLARKGTPT